MGFAEVKLDDVCGRGGLSVSRFSEKPFWEESSCVSEINQIKGEDMHLKKRACHSLCPGAVVVMTPNCRNRPSEKSLPGTDRIYKQGDYCRAPLP